MAEKVTMGKITFTPSKMFFLSGLSSLLGSPLFVIIIVIANGNKSDLSENMLAVVLSLFLLHTAFAVTGYFTYFVIKIDRILLNIPHYRGSLSIAGHILLYAVILLFLMNALEDYAVSQYLNDLLSFHYIISAYILCFVILITVGVEA